MAYDLLELSYTSVSEKKLLQIKRDVGMVLSHEL